MIRFAAVVLFCISAASVAFGAGRVECASVTSQYVPSRVGYCALLPPSYDSQPAKRFPVLYFFHGLGGDQSFLVTSGGWTIVEEAQEQTRIGEFVIITPAADSSFYINSKDGRVRYEDFLLRDFFPQMEKKYRVTTTRSGRAVGGISMGGYGALRLAFKHPQMFTAVIAHMPALLEQLPRGSANANLAPFMGTAFGRPVDEAFWKANTPFVYARTPNLAGLKIYFDCGDNDDYGFDAGTRALDSLLTQRKVPHEAHIYPGRHDWSYVAQHLPASLKFVSKAFAGK